jgi:hypothetical protein
MDEELRAELLARCEEDQRVRHRFLADRSRELAGDMHRIDEANTRWLSELVAERGWPGKTLVGEDGAHAAYLLAQHADPEPQRVFFPLMRSAAEAGEASRKDLAYMEDRVRIRNGQAQLYGTQFISNAEGFGPQAIEDPENLDRRRASVGLGPFAEYEAQMRSRHAGKG